MPGKLNKRGAHFTPESQRRANEIKYQKIWAESSFNIDGRPALKCWDCKVIKSEDEFSPSRRNHSGRRSHCKACSSKRSSERWTELKKYFASMGVSYSQVSGVNAAGRLIVAEWISKQEKRCRICRTRDPGGLRGVFHVDHDHRCCPPSKACIKCVRGLLCSKCNLGLGSFDDNPVFLKRAADYLEETRKR